MRRDGTVENNFINGENGEWKSIHAGSYIGWSQTVMENETDYDDVPGARLLTPVNHSLCHIGPQDENPVGHTSLTDSGTYNAQNPDNHKLHSIMQQNRHQISFLANVSGDFAISAYGAICRGSQGNGGSWPTREYDTHEGKFKTYNDRFFFLYFL